LIMGGWSQLAVEAAVIREEEARRRRASSQPPGSPPPAPPVPPAELASAVELCLSRMLEALTTLLPERLDGPALDASHFAFTRTLAGFGRREGLAFEDLLADLLLLREALRRHLFRYPLAARVARGLIDPFLDSAAVSLAHEWSMLGDVAAAREAEQAS